MVIGEATTDDLEGTTVIKSRHGWRPVGISGRGSARTIKRAALMVHSVELFDADKCFLSPLRGDEILLVASGCVMKLPICALSTLMKRETRCGLGDGCVFDSNER